MIISASYKTDIPAFYTDWFRNRLREGHCKMVNPYGGQVYDISLRPEDVTGFVFWSRNYGPFMEALEDVATLGLPFLCHMTVTGYPGALDVATIAPEKGSGAAQGDRQNLGARCGGLAL